MLRPVMRPLFAPVVVPLGKARRGGGGVPSGIGVWLQDDPAEVVVFETFLGRPMDLQVDFFPQSNWASWTSSIATIAARNVGKNTVWSVPICPSDGTLAEANGGTRDALYTSTAQAILGAAPAGRRVIVRIGWEFNLSSQPWNGTGGKEAAYVAGFRRIVGLFRAVSPRFVFDWCVNMSTQGTIDIDACYPGDAYVDSVSNDCYFSVGVDSDADGGAPVFGFFRDKEWGLEATRDFAIAHGKRYTIPEWNLSDTVTAYNDLLLDWIYDNAPSYHCYWEGAHVSVSAALTNGDNPLSAAAYRLRFGPPQIATSAAASGAENVAIPVSLTLAYPQTVAWSVVSGSATIAGTTLTFPAQPSGDAVTTVRATNQWGLTDDLAITATFEAPHVFVDSDAAAYVARMPIPPSEPVKADIDDFVLGLKAAGSWTISRSIYLLAIHDAAAALMDIKTADGSRDLVAVNSPSFTPWLGYTCANTGAKYLATPYNQNAASPMTDTSSWVLGWETATLSDDSPLVGVSGYGPFKLLPRNAAGNAVVNVNDYENVSFAVASSVGVLSAIKSATNATKMRKGGSTLATGTSGYNSRSAAPFIIGGGDPAAIGPHRPGALLFASAPSDAVEAATVAVIQAWATARSITAI